MTTQRVVVSGRVQGVWFRDSCRREAERLGVTGWVRNLPDGRVEGCFDGDDTAVDALIDWCRVGPPLAIVSDVAVHSTDASGAPVEPTDTTTFQIR